MITYSNPRLRAVIPHWLNDRGHVVTAVFDVEVDPKRGECAVRNSSGTPKKMGFTDRVRIIDGSDGQSYIAELTTRFSVKTIQIVFGDKRRHFECVNEDRPRFTELLPLFNNERGEAA